MQKLKLTAVALMLLPLLSGAAMAAKSVESLNIDLGAQNIGTGLPAEPIKENPPA